MTTTDLYFEDENLPINHVPYFLLCNRYRAIPLVVLTEMKVYKKLLVQIGATLPPSSPLSLLLLQPLTISGGGEGSVIGRPLQWSVKDDESTYFRYKMASTNCEAPLERSKLASQSRYARCA